MTIVTDMAKTILRFSKFCSLAPLLFVTTLRQFGMSCATLTVDTFTRKCEGCKGRLNELYITAEKRKDLARHVLYFPGDVQNYFDEMCLEKQASEWSQWSYERVASILHEKFPNSLVWIVVPSRKQDRIFSCFDNLVECDHLFCAPESYKYFDCIKHLKLLMENGCKEVAESWKYTDESSCVAELSNKEAVCDSLQERLQKLNDLPVTLVAFSKGCVVLNQFTYELQEARNDCQLTSFLTRVKSMYWLDGGHIGNTPVWITDSKVLDQLIAMNFEINVHVSLYQIKDKLRPHIGKEERIFVDYLKEMNANVTEKIHFPGKRSFTNHFKVLAAF